MNRRAKNLALMKPFFDLEANKALADARPYDMHLLCSVLMEAIIADMSGSSGGAPYSVILREVSKIALKVNPQATESELDRLTSHLIDHLSSQRGRDHFEITYQVVTPEGDVTRLSHAYRLLEQKLSPEDELVYVATPEAIHIYLSGLGHELEAEQAANDAILEHYLSRGKHKEAGEAAEMARKRSVELRARLRSWLIAAERSFEEIQYVGHVLPQLTEMQQHIRARGAIEQRQIEELQSRAIQLPPGDEGRTNLISARKAIEEASHEHTRLLTDLQQCSRTLLDFQSRQRFRLGDSPAMPEPVTEFLHPVLALNLQDLDRGLPRLLPLLLPPRLPMLPDLPVLLDALLADIRVVMDRSELEPLSEVTEDLPVAKRFTPELCATVDEFLQNFGAAYTFSSLLEAADKKFGRHSPEMAYLTVMVPQWFENEVADGRFARPACRQFETAGRFGDELEITMSRTA
ncbi:MAG: hypothetical protein C0518_02505 [Opitutus sp.]|nr:hypothetical protein [Opitutus sp.]